MKYLRDLNSVFGYENTKSEMNIPLVVIAFNPDSALPFNGQNPVSPQSRWIGTTVSLFYTQRNWSATTCIWPQFLSYSAQVPALIFIKSKFQTVPISWATVCYQREANLCQPWSEHVCSEAVGPHPFVWSFLYTTLAKAWKIWREGRLSNCRQTH